MTTEIEPIKWMLEKSEDDIWYYDLLDQEENNTLENI